MVMVLTIKGLGLTIFFITFTSSLGLVSVNNSSAASAQNSVLSQGGDNDGEQETKESQSTAHRGQVASGDSSIVSRNNQFCESHDTSNAFSGQQNICDINGIDAA